MKTYLISIILLLQSLFAQAQAQSPFDIWAETSGINKVFFEEGDNLPSNNFTAEFKTVYNSWTIKPADSIAQDYNTFYLMLYDSLGISLLTDSLDFLRIYAAFDSSASKKDLTAHGINASTFNACTWTQYGGWTTTATAYIKTGFTPSVNGVRYTLNSALIGFCTATNSAGALIDIGGHDGTNYTMIASRYSGDLVIGRVNQASPTFFSNASTSSIGFWIGIRRTSTTLEYYKNISTLGTDTDVSVGLPSKEYYLGGWNANGSLDSPAIRQYRADFAGGKLSAAGIRKLVNCVEWLLDQWGAGVQ